MKLRQRTEPLWREEFSVRAADERYVTRRQFGKFLVLTSLGMCVGNTWILVKSWFRSETRFPVQPVAQLREIPIGGVKLFRYPGPDDPCILVRSALDAYVAYSQKCTHLSCAVYYERDSNRLKCPCHQGAFSIADGRVLQGPPPRPLPQIVLERQGDLLAAVGIRPSMEA
jgi:nitrite reductase/ring-hydroxylating ferredoxin subunit